MKIKDRFKQFLSNKSVTTKVSLLIVLCGLFTFIVGGSYAILNGEVSANNEQVIKAGNVEVLLTEYFDNINKKISIMSDEDGLLQEEVYNFNIKNIGEVAGKYKIVLNNEEPSDYTGDVLSSEYIKIGLEVNDEEYGPFTLEEANNILDSGIIYKKELIDYNLRIWLDESASEELAAMEDYKAFLSLDVTIEQKSDSSDEGITKTFSYTGDYQTYKISRDGTYKIELWGASGNNNYNAYVSANPSYSGYTAGEIYLEAGEKLYFYVGGMKETFNCCSKQSTKAGSGGATDVRLVSDVWDDEISLRSRIMVAGGAGGTYSDSTGARGGAAGGLKSYAVSHANHPVTISTQTSGGTAGTTGTAGGFGYGGINTATNYNSGAGGYYGGGSGPSGGGGSSYISGHTGCVAVLEDSTTARTGTGGASCITETSDNLCSVHYSGKVFTNTVMIDGTGKSWENTVGVAVAMPNPDGGTYELNVGHNGSGFARISYLR